MRSEISKLSRQGFEGQRTCYDFGESRSSNRTAMLSNNDQAGSNIAVYPSSPHSAVACRWLHWFEVLLRVAIRPDNVEIDDRV